MKSCVEFRSDCFPAYDGEEKKINPGLWGKRLSEFVRDGLRARGFDAGEPLAVDWGWLIPIGNESFRLWVGCGRYQEYPDGFLRFVEAHVPVIRRFPGKVDIRGRVASARRSI